MQKLYVIVRADLPPGDQAVQSCHAALEFAMGHREKTARWSDRSNYLALLSVPDEAALLRLLERAREERIEASPFYEPDFDNSLTAVALEPGDRSRRLCRNLTLTLRFLGSDYVEE